MIKKPNRIDNLDTLLKTSGEPATIEAMSSNGPKIHELELMHKTIDDERKLTDNGQTNVPMESELMKGRIVEIAISIKLEKNIYTIPTNMECIIKNQDRTVNPTYLHHEYSWK